jgi:hypothetical protein
MTAAGAREFSGTARREWQQHRRPPEVRVPWFRKRKEMGGGHVSRSLIEINFHGGEPR